jgi:hypothetical protein
MDVPTVPPQSYWETALERNDEAMRSACSKLKRDELVRLNDQYDDGDDDEFDDGFDGACASRPKKAPTVISPACIALGKVLCMRSAVLGKLGRYREAIVAATTALRVHRGCFAARQNRMVARRMLGDDAAIIIDASAALDSACCPSTADAAAMHAMRAAAHLRRGEWDEALADCAAAHERGHRGAERLAQAVRAAHSRRASADATAADGAEQSTSARVPLADVTPVVDEHTRGLAPPVKRPSSDDMEQDDLVASKRLRTPSEEVVLVALGSPTSATSPRGCF